MKQLYLMRHASPARYGPDGTDFSRPLTETGMLEAESQARYFLGGGIVVDKVVSSSAVRAKHTAEILVESLHKGGQTPQIEITHGLYNAGVGELLSEVQAQPAKVNTLLIVAHMPGVAEFFQLILENPSLANLPFLPGTLVGMNLALNQWDATNPGLGQFATHAPPDSA